MEEKIISLKENGNGIVKKAQQLVESRYSLTVMEIKIISELITMVKVTDTVFHEYVFKVDEWKNEKDLKRKDIYKAFENVARDLMSKPLTIRSTDSESWLVVNWVSSAQYIKGKGIVKFQISDKLKPYLLALKEHFLQYDIKNILPLRSSYVIRLYELLKDWYNAGFRYSQNKTVTKIIDLRWLRQTFQIPDKYRYNNIKERILLKAQSDLPKYTDIKFKFDEIKEGHRVTHLKFTIQGKGQKKEKMDKTQAKQELADQQIKLILKDVPEQYRTGVEKIIKKHTDKDIKYIIKQIEYTNNSNPKSYLAFLTAAIENDYAAAAAAEAEAKQQEQEQKIKRLTEKEEYKKKKAEEEEIKKLEDYFLSMTKQEQDELKNEALNQLHKLYPNAPATSATFGELSVDIMVKKILREKIDSSRKHLKAQL